MSNIAWTTGNDAAAYALLSSCGFAGVELAPTRLWPHWHGADVAAAQDVRAMLQAQQLEIPALQSLFYGKQGMSVFGDAGEQSAMLDHLDQLADLAAALGARHLVFGSPALRNRGNLSQAEAMLHAAGFFARAAQRMALKPVCLCIEPNPPRYGCNFVTTAAEGAALVRAVNLRGFRLHLDVAGMWLAGDDARRSIESCADVLAHVHASEPELGGFEQLQADHAGAAAGLRAIGWNAWVSVEMRVAEPELERVAVACRQMADIYGD